MAKKYNYFSPNLNRIHELFDKHWDAYEHDFSNILAVANEHETIDEKNKPYVYAKTVAQMAAQATFSSIISLLEEQGILKTPPGYHDPIPPASPASP